MSKKNDDEITIDFKKVLGFLKLKKKPASHKKKEPQEDDEITFDSSKVMGFIGRYWSFLLILIPILINIYFRLYPHYLPITDDFARQSVYNLIRNDVTNQVNQEYPNLPAQNKNDIINERFNAVLNQQKDAVEQAVQQNSEFLKTKFKDDLGYTYLGDIDSYFYMRYAQNILDHGTQGDEIRDGIPYDDYMQAPLGRPVEKNIYPYFEAAVYRITKLFEPNMTLMQAAFLTPLFLSTIALIFAFLIGKKLAGNIGGFFASMIIAVHPTILSRSLGSDNDIVNIIFPLIILFFFIWSITSKKRSVKIIYGSLAGFFVGFYKFAWSGWWYIFYFLMGSIVMYLGYHFIFHFREIRKKPISFFDPEVKNILIISLFFLIFTVIGLAAFGNLNELNIILRRPIDVTTLKAAARGVWPNVYTTVAELNPASLGETINGVGSKYLFLLALMGIISTLIDFKKQKVVNISYLVFSFFWFLFLLNNTSMQLLLFLFLLSIPIIIGIIISIYFKYKIDIKYAIILISWYLATIYAASKGIRFILLLIPPFAIALSIAVGLIYEFIISFSSKHLYINKTIAQVIALLLILGLLVSPIRAGERTAKSYLPHVNDAWYDSLTKIKTETSRDAIINSWWDFGHWFKALADRRVTFDGASQNSPVAYWIGKVLLTEDQDTAIGILRMLDCGSNSAFEELNKYLDNSILTIDIINQIVVLDRKDAKEVLVNYISDQRAEKVLTYTHCQPPEDYFITSEDMVGKSGVWAHFGSWDFMRSEIHNLYDTLPKQDFINTLVTELGYTKDDAASLYENELLKLKTDREVNDWIAPWPSYGGMTGCSFSDNVTVVCNVPAGNNQYIPMNVNVETGESYVNTQDNQMLHPARIGYFKDGEFTIREYTENKIPNDFSFVLVNQSGNYAMILMSPELVGSMFTRLFFLDGAGLDHFERFNDVTDIQGQRIITWKIKWQD